MPNNNKSGMGTPGTQKTAQNNAVYGGVNPNMPAGQQLARQGASSYQQSLVPGAPTAGVKYAQQAFPGPSPTPPAQPSPLSGLPHKEALGLNASLGFSNETVGITPWYTPASGESATPMSNFVGYSRGQANQPGQPQARGRFGSPTAYQEALANAGGTPGGASPAGYQDSYYPQADGPVPDETPLRNLMTPEGASDEYWGTYHETYPGEATEDFVGFDPETLDEIEQDFIDHAEMSIQEGLAALSRQYANMGMGGSGAHMVANNALVADVYKQLQEQMNALEMANLEQQEIDMQERIDNARNLLLDSAVVDAQAVSSFAEILGVSDSPIMQTFISSLEEQGKVFGPDEFNALMNAVIKLAQSGGEDTSGMEALMAEMGTSGAFFEQGPYGVINYANTQSSKQFQTNGIHMFIFNTGELPADFWGLIKDSAAAAGLSYSDIINMFKAEWGKSWNPPGSGSGQSQGGSESLEDQGVSYDAEPYGN